MKNNNIVESQYIGWVFWSPGTTPFLPETFDVAVWRNTNGSTEMNEGSQLTLKRITSKVVRNDRCGFRSDGPIIHVKPIDENQTFCKVGSVFSNLTKTNIDYCKFSTQQKLIIKTYYLF